MYMYICTCIYEFIANCHVPRKAKYLHHSNYYFTGNIGESLNRFDYSGLRLYISDNGGVIWRELYSGYKEFQLLNYGVFTAVVDKWIPASYVL